MMSIATTLPASGCVHSVFPRNNYSCRRFPAFTDATKVQKPHRSHILMRPQAAFNLFDLVKPKGSKQQGAVDELLSLAEGTALGASTSPEVKAKILDIVEVLAQSQSGATTTDSRISATWKVAWTTEKETLFIVKNAGLFGTKAGGVYQVHLFLERRVMAKDSECVGGSGQQSIFPAHRNVET
jgi:hypothetical protein